MGTTTRFGLRYPALTDAPNGPQLAQFLAEDVEAHLSRLFVCTSTTRPAGVGDRFVIGETDTGNVLYYNASSSQWVQIGGGTSGSGGGGGGGAGSAVEGQWRATSNQTIPHNTDTVLSFGNTETSSAVVTRATLGSGHKFTLDEAGCYAITATIRFVAGTTGSRFIELRNSAQTARFVASGDQGGPAAATRSFSLTKRFTAGQELVVIAAQSSGGSLTTQYQGDSISDGFVRLTIVKLTD